MRNMAVHVIQNLSFIFLKLGSNIKRKMGSNESSLHHDWYFYYIKYVLKWSYSIDIFRIIDGDHSKSNISF